LRLGAAARIEKGRGFGADTGDDRAARDTIARLELDTHDATGDRRRDHVPVADACLAFLVDGDRQRTS
jgi:hypothetical protein